MVSAVSTNDCTNWIILFPATLDNVYGKERDPRPDLARRGSVPHPTTAVAEQPQHQLDGAGREARLFGSDHGRPVQAALQAKGSSAGGRC
jgi:hypothetical protein